MMVVKYTRFAGHVEPLPGLGISEDDEYPIEDLECADEDMCWSPRKNRCYRDTYQEEIKTGKGVDDTFHYCCERGEWIPRTETDYCGVFSESRP
jgi:hypothetical protein